MRLYVVRTMSGHLWLTRGRSAAAIKAKWQAEVAAGEAEELMPTDMCVSRPRDRQQINYLRQIGQADA